MTLTPTADPPLLGLFLRLREAGYPWESTSISWPFAASKPGVGQPDRAALRRLCAALWVKSADDERIFAAHFDEALTATANDEADSRPPADKQEAAREVSPSRTDTDVETAPSGQELPDLLTALARQVDDEVQAAAAVAHVASGDTEARRARYLLTSDYLPVTKRQMKQGWRFLRQQVREGPLEEVDVEADHRPHLPRGLPHRASASPAADQPGRAGPPESTPTAPWSPFTV